MGEGEARLGAYRCLGWGEGEHLGAYLLGVVGATQETDSCLRVVEVLPTVSLLGDYIQDDCHGSVGCWGSGTEGVHYGVAG